MTGDWKIRASDLQADALWCRPLEHHRSRNDSSCNQKAQIIVEAVPRNEYEPRQKTMGEMYLTKRTVVSERGGHCSFDPESSLSRSTLTSFKKLLQKACFNGFRCCAHWYFFRIPFLYIFDTDLRFTARRISSLSRIDYRCANR